MLDGLCLCARQEGNKSGIAEAGGQKEGGYVQSTAYGRKTNADMGKMKRDVEGESEVKNKRRKESE